MQNEVTWLTKGLEGWGLEFGWRIKLLIWETKQLYRLGLIEMADVKAVVEGVEARNVIILFQSN